MAPKGKLHKNNVALPRKKPPKLLKKLIPNVNDFKEL